MNQNFQKWEIYEVIAMGFNSASRGYVESIYLEGLTGLSSRIHDEVLDFFEKLTWDTYAFEQARGTLENPIHGESTIHATPSH